uniref:Uncharacterized protein n=1 Tax=Avena sativa TaxID=4498 RepID=A0ACD5T7R1_AVESA
MDANGGGEGLEDGGDHALAYNALANDEDQVLAMEMEAGGALGNGGLNHGQVLLAPDGVVPAQAVVAAAAVNPALNLVFLRLPAQEIARCRSFCRLWRDVTSSEDFRRRHRAHHYRTPMPIFFFQDPDRRLYACNPCTRRWAHLPPLHVENDIVGFYATGVYHGHFRCHVLYHDRAKSDCAYWIFTVGTAALPPITTHIGRPGADADELGGLDRVLANGILPSYKIPPVFVANILHWLPQAARDNRNVITFDTFLRSFAMIPPPTVQAVNDGPNRPAVGGQLFEIDQRLAMTVISPATVDVWVRCNVAQLWNLSYSIILPVNDISLHDGYHHDGRIRAGVFAVAQDRNYLVQCPRIMLQCDALGAVLHNHLLADHRTFLSRHTIEESLLLHPSLLLMQGRDDVAGEPPFFQNQ